MRYAIFALLAALLMARLGAFCPASAQILGAPPGYSNATLKGEQQRQKLQMQQRQAAQAAAAKAAADQAAQAKH